MATEIKILIGLVILAVLGVGIYIQSNNTKEECASKSCPSGSIPVVAYGGTCVCGPVEKIND